MQRLATAVPCLSCRPGHLRSCATRSAAGAVLPHLPTNAAALLPPPPPPGTASLAADAELAASLDRMIAAQGELVEACAGALTVGLARAAGIWGG